MPSQFQHVFHGLTWVSSKHNIINLLNYRGILGVMAFYMFFWIIRAFYRIHLHPLSRYLAHSLLQHQNLGNLLHFQLE